MSKEFPKEERYALTDQIRKSTRSVGTQIAEAGGKRRYKKHFVIKLTDVTGELFKSQHWIETTGTCEYIPPDVASDEQRDKFHDPEIQPILQKKGK